MNTIKIPNKSIIQDFKEHLNLELNQRILFTAPFGAGKSTFINDFEKANKIEYRFIRLYPVNYAVSANEDVFELIKFDILYELMAHYQAEINLQEKDFDFWLRMSMFMQNKADLMPLFLHIISLHETIGKPISKFIEVIKPLVNDFKTYTKEVNINESDDIFSFLETFKNEKGSQYEMDATSQFIYDLVDRLKGDLLPEQEEIKEVDEKRVNKTVLVIDDLDRLDPDHIFRLFNIFSAHTHSIDGENKFGFDKVIFVCDIENIRKIYAHKYGKGVDFAGYMDKFYSLKPFEFDNNLYINEVLFQMLLKYNVTIEDKRTAKRIRYTQYYEQTELRHLFSAVLKIFLHYKFINLRTIINISNINVFPTKGVIYNEEPILSIDYSLLNVFEFLKQLIGGQNNLENAFKVIKSTKEKLYDKNQTFANDFDINIDEFKILEKEVFKTFIDPRLVNEKNHKPVKYEALGLEIKLINSVRGLKIKNVTIAQTEKPMNNLINYDLLLYEAYKKFQEYELIPLLSKKL
ncbi:P-loop NTPase fold protein [Myroides marinus]|uniref:P-loop NTPase fold protein n=1 Tax=Myroides marinus TaxID=703342 RepID=UPI002578942E|nr:P-loop NTPase fold protein [Myroides marinus]MDM1404509.1 hypothetical protein [Myroides marinus]MDM1534238.1 hypothetical protein [Myroides marinus]MDM1541202.1 hypothetical protein [Myroides marinus]